MDAGNSQTERAPVDREDIENMVRAEILNAMMAYDREVIGPRQQKMHDDNKHTYEERFKKLEVKVGDMWDHLQRGKGAYWAGATLLGVVVIVVQHYWK